MSAQFLKSKQDHGLPSLTYDGASDLFFHCARRPLCALADQRQHFGVLLTNMLTSSMWSKKFLSNCNCEIFSTLIFSLQSQFPHVKQNISVKLQRSNLLHFGVLLTNILTSSMWCKNFLSNCNGEIYAPFHFNSICERRKFNFFLMFSEE